MLFTAPYLTKRAALARGGGKPGQVKGQPAPDFSLQTLDDKPVHLADYRGKAVC